MLRTPVNTDIIAIYETRKTRVTHAHTQVIDLRPMGEKYAIVCVTHDQAIPYRTRLEAESISHKPQLFCTACDAIANPPAAEDEVTSDAEVIDLDALGASDAEVIDATCEDVTDDAGILEIESGIDAPHGFTKKGTPRKRAA
jgi:hypothetical protein